ncbi:molybdenum cofactor biosynthesis protein B [Camelliibacillus cellulosilyticus]|uniref:Molybdenum cofactor biosynthesis protein B n=1 Tax=Camelliibacillus cellulosilyticus TaxID=2174486 RepID=A0ABV9GM86_9BACL
MTVHDHRRQAPQSVTCAVLTVSDTRTMETDRSGRLIAELLKDAGHSIKVTAIEKDEKDAIGLSLQRWLMDPKIEAILINGGTGIAPRDVTIEVVQPLLDKELPGFGELFRLLSFTDDIGSAAMLSRALAGSAAGKAIFTMPGSQGAVRLAMERLILPELGHIVSEIKKST